MIEQICDGSNIYFLFPIFSAKGQGFIPSTIKTES